MKDWGPTEKVRADAIRICAVLASTPGASWLSAQASLGIRDPRARALAYMAWDWAFDMTSTPVERLDAEAECLLREGWCP